MSKSWLFLIILGLIFLLAITGIEVYQSFGGKETTKSYTVDQIEPKFDQSTLDFLGKNQDKILKNQDEI